MLGMHIVKLSKRLALFGPFLRVQDSFIWTSDTIKTEKKWAKWENGGKQNDWLKKSIKSINCDEVMTSKTPFLLLDIEMLLINELIWF